MNLLYYFVLHHNQTTIESKHCLDYDIDSAFTCYVYSSKTIFDGDGLMNTFIIIIYQVTYYVYALGYSAIFSSC